MLQKTDIDAVPRRSLHHVETITMEAPAMSLGIDYLDSLLEDDKEGIFRCKREMFTDPRLFDLEMKHIFEGQLVYLATRPDPRKNDYYTTQMGRQPIFIARNKEGELNAFINACSHRGAMLCRFKSGNKSTYTCPFHGWTFNNSGKLLKVKDPKEAGYPDSFNCDGSHDLKKVARFESYRGFLFGSLREDVAPLEEFLGESKKIIDMVVDQSPEGIEVLRGSSTYVYEGNWKLQAENGADGYHVTAVHWNYAATQQQRKLKGSRRRHPCDERRRLGQEGRWFLFLRERPSTALDSLGQPGRSPVVCPSRGDGRRVRPGPYRLDDRELAQPVPLSEPVPDGSVRLAAAHRQAAVGGQDRSHHLLHRTQGRVPKRGRGAFVSTDFFNVSGMATPDDLEEFRACQQGFAGRAMEWNDMSRGAKHWIEGRTMAPQHRPAADDERCAHRG